MFHVKHYLANALNPDSELPVSDLRTAFSLRADTAHLYATTMPQPIAIDPSSVSPDGDSDMNHTTVI